MMEHDAKFEIAGAAVQTGVQGGLVGAAASIVSGAAIGSATTATPIRILWGLITVGMATVTTPIWLPGVIAACTVGGAVVGGVAGAAGAYRRIKTVETEWESLCGTDQDD